MPFLPFMYRTLVVLLTVLVAIVIYLVLKYQDDLARMKQSLDTIRSTVLEIEHAVSVLKIGTTTATAKTVATVEKNAPKIKKLANNIAKDPIGSLESLSNIIR